jgi:hypothetical protein
VCNICFGAANKHALGNVQNKLKVFSFIKLSGNTAITEEDMPRRERSELDPNKAIEQYAYEVLKLTFALALLVVVCVDGLKHFKDMVPQSWWVWALLPVIALLLRVSFSIYRKLTEEETASDEI